MGPVGCPETSVWNHHFSLCVMCQKSVDLVFRSSVGIGGTCQLLLVIGIEETGTAVLECIVNCL